MGSIRTKRRAKIIAQKNDQLRVLFDNTNEHGICMLDARGRILSWNMSSERLMGYSAHEVVGKNFSMFFSPAEKRGGVAKNVLNIAAKKARYMADGIRVRKDGTHFWARSFLTLVRGDSRSPTYFVLITQDITDSRAQELKREEYIGIASHELKNPITTLSLYSELLADRLELDTDKKSLNMLRDIQGQAARLVTLVDDLLVVSKIEGGKLDLNKEVFNPRALIAKIARDFKAISPAHSVTSTGMFRGLVRADKERIAQVLINLITNAIKYSPGGRRVIVRIDKKNRKCVVSIQDFGPGIPKKDMNDVFERFFRTIRATASEVNGTGLGLYISKEIIRRHREKIWLKSSVGKGTTFFFTLPLSQSRRMK